MTAGVKISAPPLPEYRLYVLDEADRIYRPAHYLEAPTDDLAIEIAARLLDRRVIELWRGARLVARLEPDRARPARG